MTRKGYITSLHQVFRSFSKLRFLDWQDNLDAHVFSLVHDLAIDNRLVCTNTVVDCVCRVGACSNLNFSPLLVGGDKAALVGEPLELLVDALLFDAAFSLDEW
jgi:hypothetical protein